MGRDAFLSVREWGEHTWGAFGSSREANGELLRVGRRRWRENSKKSWVFRYLKLDP